MPAILLLALSLLALPAAGKVPDDHDADVVASGRVHAAPEAVLAWVSDLRNQEQVLGDCTRRWFHADNNVGVGASAELVYKIGMWRRKLVGTISKVEAQRVTVDHAGNKGFYTTWTVTPTQDGVDLEIHTLLNLAPRPFRKYYVNRVQGPWQQCYAAAIVRVDEALR